MPLTATVRKPANGIDPLFGWFSSQLIFDASPGIESYRKRILRTLKDNDYSVGLVSRLTFFPHISVRLGVPYNTNAKALAEQNFPPGAKAHLRPMDHPKGRKERRQVPRARSVVLGLPLLYL